MVSTSSNSVKPLMVTWATYLLVMELVAMLSLPRAGLFSRMDFQCFYAAGVLTRTDPSHLYDLAQQEHSGGSGQSGRGR